jgi:hypothetical protein
MSQACLPAPIQAILPRLSVKWHDGSVEHFDDVFEDDLTKIDKLLERSERIGDGGLRFSIQLAHGRRDFALRSLASVQTLHGRGNLNTILPPEPSAGVIRPDA